MADEARLVVYDGAAWIEASANLNPTPLLGVATSADTTNRLAVASSASLFTHAGASHRLAINKKAAADTASIVFQQDYNAVAEMGLTGDNALRLKVKTAAGQWRDALRANDTSLQVDGDIVLTKPGGRLLFHDTAANPDSGKSAFNKPYDFSLYYAGGTWTNGPASEPTYADDVWAWGVNMAGVGVKARADMQYAAWHIESKYYQGPTQTAPATEVHFQVVDPAGGVHRPITGFFPTNGAATSVVLGAGWVSLQNYANTPKVDFKFDNNSIEIAAGLVTNYFGAGVLAYQTYAPGISGALPYLDDQGSTVLGVAGAVTTQPAPGSSNATGPILRASGGSTRAAVFKATGGGSVDMVFEQGLTQSASTPISVTCNGGVTIAFAPGAITKNDIGRTLAGANVVGAPVIGDLNPLASTITVNIAQPATVTSVTLGARTMRSAQIGLDAGGNLILRGNAGAGSMYFDINSAWYIRDMNAGYAQRLYMDGNGFWFKTPVRLPQYAKASVPSASSAGAGAMIYVGDATAGAGVYASDGANWRVVGTLGATLS